MFLVGKSSSNKIQNLGLKIPIPFSGKIEILSTHNLLCRVCWEICSRLSENFNFLPLTFVTRDAAGPVGRITCLARLSVRLSVRLALLQKLENKTA